jgi:molybdopterin converting factor small subunit
VGVVRVALFAGMAEAAGCREAEIEWPGGTVADLKAALGRRWPAIAPLLARSAVAVGGRYAADDLIVGVGTADVAVIPPVSGG